MKQNELNDERLKEVVQQWKVSAPLPPRFQEQVWRRIERADTAQVSLRQQWVAEFLQLFTRPVTAYSYVTVLLALGLTIGYLRAQQEQTRFESQLAARYVQSIDPYQKGHE